MVKQYQLQRSTSIQLKFLRGQKIQPDFRTGHTQTEKK